MLDTWVFMLNWSNLKAAVMDDVYYIVILFKISRGYKKCQKLWIILSGRTKHRYSCTKKFLTSIWVFVTHLKKNFHLTSNKEISVEFACDTAANVICVVLVGGEFSGIRDVPKSTGIVVWPCENLVTVWSKVRYVDSPEQKNKMSDKLQFISTTRHL